MLTNFLIVTSRHLLRNRFISSLRLAGLALGYAAFLVISEYVDHEKSFDNFHNGNERLFRVTHKFLKDGDVDFHVATTFPKVGPAMKEDFPEIEGYCRLLKKYRPGIVKHQDKFFREENLFYADASFFSLFSYPLIAGDTSRLREPNTAAIDANTAKKYFGSVSPLGKSIQVSSQSGLEEFEIIAVFESLPKSHIHFAFVFSFESYLARNPQAQDLWSWYDFLTYVKLTPNTSVEQLAAKFPAFADKYGGEKLGSNRVGFELQPITSIHLASNLVNEVMVNGNARSIQFMTLLSIFILAMGLINYVNLATAKALSRGKEIGIRKSLGSLKISIAIQFLVESLLLNLIAIISGITLFILLVPMLNDIVGITLELRNLAAPAFWLTTLILWLASSVVSGLYPMLVMASFNPIHALKHTRTGMIKQANFRQALVIFQFTITTFVIASTLLVRDQLNYMMTKDTGIQVDSVLVVVAPNAIDSRAEYQGRLQTLKNSLLAYGYLRDASISSEIPGKAISWYSRSKRLGGTDEIEPTLVYKVNVDEAFFDAYDVTLEGRSLIGSFDSLNVVINHKGLEALGFPPNNRALNEKIIMGLDTVTIVGIVENFHQEKLSEPFRPTIFFSSSEEQNYICLRYIQSIDEVKLGEIGSTYQKIFPEAPFEYFYASDFIMAQYESDRIFLNLFVIFSLLTVAIGLFGLVGLVYYATAQRRKEIAMRKVLGSSVGRLFFLLTSETIKLIVIANIIAIPIVIIFGNNWLSTFAFHGRLDYETVIISILFTLAFALISISRQIWLAAVENPVNLLKNE